MKKNAGFTLVEMVVVLTIMSIMLGATAWGVTGWIEHYEYISSEEKARTVYMAAQSALSAAESRGTLDECMAALEKEGKTINDAEKAAYGLPDYIDNEKEKHKYIYLSACKGQYAGTAGSVDQDDTYGSDVLYELLRTYISDTEQLNGSIVVEFDLTAKKVYGVFYSTWASRLTYQDVPQNEVRGIFQIDVESRKPENREDFAVGYYGVDQVNVVKLKMLQELKVTECILHNEETLNLTMRSSSQLQDSDTVFTVELYEKASDPADPDSLVCSFSVAREMLKTVDPGKTMCVNSEVYGGDGSSLGEYPFILSFEPETAPDQGDYCLRLVLDALCTGQSLAMVDTPQEKNGLLYSDLRGFSITRLLGVAPKDIFARVSVAPNGASIYTVGGSEDSNVENDLFRTKSAGASDADTYEIAYCRHLSNVRYVEEYLPVPAGSHFTYQMKEDCDWGQGIIYNCLQGTDPANPVFAALDTSVTGFPMIPKLNPGSVFEGEGKQISNLVLTNESGVYYAHGDDGKVVKSPPTNAPVNTAKTLGLFGTNYGTIRRVIFAGAKENALSAAQFAAAGGTNDPSIYSDTIEAAGVVCGRNAGYMRELAFDKDCSVEACVAVSLDDSGEAKAAAGVKGVSYAADSYENQKYASGVGMAAGTVELLEDAVFDRIYTAGTVKGTFLAGKDYKDTPLVDQTEARKKIYDDSIPDEEGRTNARSYAYGIGGVFGYVYGAYRSGIDQLGLGIDENKVAANAALAADAGGYLIMYKRVLENGELVPGTQAYMEADDTRSIINKASVEGASFTGGVVGNVYVSGLAGNAGDDKDTEGHQAIPAHAVPQLVNCHNYGDTKGTDFVGGVVGVNGEGGYILKCSSYGSPSATAGVSAGIASENYGYIAECLLDRAAADEEHGNEPYVPDVNGNMIVAGAITSVNHADSVVKDCRCAVAELAGVSDKILITGKEMDTFGFLVGNNEGVVNGGRAGVYLGYKSPKTKLVIGGAVGTNRNVIKNVTVSFDLVDKGQADCIGGIAGENYKCVRNCRFGGKITKSRKCASGLAIGGIAGRNGDGSAVASIEGCYLVGAQIDVKGSCGFEETNSEERKLSMSSAVGGVCGINQKMAELKNCYVTCLSESTGEMKRQSSLQVKNGMAGGIVAANLGTVQDCGYTDRVFYEDDEKSLVILDRTVPDMKFAVTVQKRLENTGASMNPYALFMDDIQGELLDSVKELCGILSVKQDSTLWANALPKKAYEAFDEQDVSRPAYDASGIHYMISLKENGKGYIGGIAGYNGQGATLTKCATGKWVVEAYHPDPKYRSILADGGVIGENAAKTVTSNLNLAYVRLELEAIPLSGLNNFGQDIGLHDRKFFYVGGVIGNQRNVTESGWIVEKCVNAGTVLNYFGNNAGGVISRVTENGGTVQSCYNYGTLMTGYTEGNLDNANDYGTAGGIVSHYTELNPDQFNAVLDCENHGIVGLAMEGVDPLTNKRISKMGGMMANDSGGVVGEISAPDGKSLYTVNIKNCVNGRHARVYSYSTDAGILGKIGCFAKNGNVLKDTVNNIFVNIDSCRNYSSQIWNCQNLNTNNSLKKNSAGILSGRQVYSGNNQKLGYTTVRNCLSVKMVGFDRNGYMVRNDKSKGLDVVNGTTEAKADYNQMGKIASEKKTDRMQKVLETYKYCSNNYFVDERSFQYSERGRINKNGYVERENSSNINNGDMTKVNALVAATVPVPGSVVPASGTAGTDLDDIRRRAYDNYMDPLSLCLDAKRLISVTYQQDGGNRYGMAFIPYEYDISGINTENAYVSDGGKKLHLCVDSGEVVCDLLSVFGEKAAPATYSAATLDYFQFVQTHPTTSRLPFADEFDPDYLQLDSTFVEYIEAEKQKLTPDRVTRVQVIKNPDVGNYLATWEFENPSTASATEFDVKIAYYKILAGTAFPPDDLDAHSPVKTEDKKAYGTTTTFTTPSDLEMEAGYAYYAVVRVKDSRGGESYYSDVQNEADCKSYILLDPKLPAPEFEFVSFEGKWQLHLKNAKAYKEFAGKSGFKLGVYALNKNSSVIETTRIEMKASDLSFADQEDHLLSNAKIVPEGKTIYDLMNLELYSYAKADGCLDADQSRMMVYIPSNPVPNVVCEQTDVTDHLNDRGKKPEYSAKLHYLSFDDNTEMPAAQMFRLELYGEKTVKDGEGNPVMDGEGNLVKCHETVASREIAVDVGEEMEFEIGYYDAPSDVDLSVYESFSVDCWCSGSGLGDVRYYIELPVDQMTDSLKNRVQDQLRGTGFITDLFRKEYDFRSIMPLPVPEVEVVCLERNAGGSPAWYARLLNPESFAGTQARVRVRFENSSVDRTQEIDLSDHTLQGGVLPYAVRINQSGTTASAGKLTYWAYQEGFVSVVQHYSPSKQNVWLQRNLDAGLHVNLQMAVKDTVDGEGHTVPGFALDREEKTLTFRGAVNYHSHMEIPQYYRYELYAFDQDNQPVTLYLSDDQVMKKAANDTETDLYGSDPVEITLQGDYLLQYHNFHAAVWYSKADISKEEPGSAEGHSFRQCFEMTEEEATAAAAGLDVYDTENGRLMKEARSRGFLLYDNGNGEKQYYYAAPLKDPKYAERSASPYKNRVLYAEPEQTVAAVWLDNESVKVEGTYVQKVTWMSEPNFYGQDVKAEVQYSVYQWEKGAAAPTAAQLETLEQNNRAWYQGTALAANYYAVNQTAEEKTNYPLDWSTSDYYALVRIKDRYATGYSDYKAATLLKPLPTPRISMYNLGWQGDFVHLDNYQEYAEYGDNVKVYVSLTGENAKTYEINAASAATTSKIPFSFPLPYCTVMEKHTASNLRAWAQQVDPDTHEVINESVDSLETHIYLPGKGNPIPLGHKLILSDTSCVADMEHNQVHLNTKVKFTCDTSPGQEQGFSILLVGKPNVPLRDGFTEDKVILYRTEDHYLGLNKDETKEVSLDLTLDDSVHLSDYQDLKVYVRHSDLGNTDFVIRQEAEMTEEAFYQVPFRTRGLLVDLSGVTGQIRYTFQRFLGDTNRENNNFEQRGYAETGVTIP